MSYEFMFDELISKMKKYHPSDDFSMLQEAYDIARKAHGDQLRDSGEPYIIHPLSVAVILADLEMDRETIAAGILHDVIEDTVYTYDNIKDMFGDEVANLVEGVTKLEKLQYSSFEDEQAENYRKLFLAMSNDIRVIIIKIADRLHNMRTLKYRPPVKQKKVAQETLDIYCPLAHRLGISKIRYDLEDLSFRYLETEAYYDLRDKIQRKQHEREEYVQMIVEQLISKLSLEGIEASIEGRPKHFFSIYKKMVSQRKTLDQIYDLFAVRVIVSSVRDCYEVLGVVHEMYKPIPGRFKDYIAIAKANMYQSLHNTLIGPGGEPFEVQIRTWDMHRTAEYGIAAHWKYKENKNGGVDKEEKLSWLREMLEWQRDFSDNREFLDALKFDLNVFKNHVYCFTPKGQVISLANGSTPIDFAYAIHSAVGNKMIGAKVNNKIVPIEFTLSTGDRVEILTSQNSKGPSHDWLKIVKTSQARSKINQWFKKENKEENIIRGREMLEKGAKKKGVVLSHLLSPEYLPAILNRYSLKDWDAVCAAVGHGSLKEGQVINRLNEEYERKKGKLLDNDERIKRLVNADEKELPKTKTKDKAKKGLGVIVKGAGDISPRFSKCCSPVPGDEIVAYVTRGRGLSVHRSDCPNIVVLDDLEKHRVVEAEWQLPEKTGPEVLFRADIKLVCDDRVGLLMDISRTLNNENMNVMSMNARSVKNAAIFNVALNISGKNELETISKKLLNLPGVRDVERVSI